MGYKSPIFLTKVPVRAVVAAFCVEWCMHLVFGGSPIILRSVIIAITVLFYDGGSSQLLLINPPLKPVVER